MVYYITNIINLLHFNNNMWDREMFVVAGIQLINWQKFITSFLYMAMYWILLPKSDNNIKIQEIPLL